MELRAWRERLKQGEQFCLPSGLEVRLRRAGLLDLMATGRIPAPLVGTVEAIMDRKEVRMTVAEFPKFVQVINAVVIASVIAPEVAEEPGETVVGVEELPVADRLAIFNWATQPGEELRPFRQTAGESVGGVLPGDGVRQPSLLDSGD